MASAQFSTWLTRIAINEVAGSRPPPGPVRGVRRRTLECGAVHVPQSLRESRAAGIHQRAARTAGMGDRHAARRHARGLRAARRGRSEHVGSGRVPRRHRRRRQDAAVARPRRVAARHAGANRRDRTGSVSVLSSSLRPCRRSCPRPDRSSAARSPNRSVPSVCHHSIGRHSDHPRPA